MAPNAYIPRKPDPDAQVVRGPTRGDGIGHALRRTFGHDADVPDIWQHYLAAIDRTGRH